MKTNILTLLFFLALSIMVSAQDTRQFTEKGFTRISMGSAFKVNVEQGANFRIVATGRQEDLSALKATVKGGTLSLGYDNNIRQNNRSEVKINIIMPSLEAVDFSGASKVNVGRFSGAKNIDVEVSGASKVMMDLSADKVAVSLSGASGLGLKGSCAVLNGEVSGASSLKAMELICEEVIIEASGASSAQVVAQKELRAEASGASSVRYAGAVKNVQSHTSGASSVKRK
ncbi:putative autotransporter adhesin-like protein [Dyadobacter jejuensis]|uniref:Putative autotransporter adhesin-like protein n=1 Tax=Dyadobacter jejuensis TaxID=1082580 RepID=A0A316ARP7_9BACT|nr:head GIN domain-containing protein [Dyadobacter jejuensis]PWJ60188.1 putative autotransporter adhesin-like protein [Dyadobacter jejuensis]